MSVDFLLARQNADGGWPYLRGASWTEPTVYAALALLAEGAVAEVQRGVAWLRGLERADGGYPPRQGVDESTWVTALVALVPGELLGEAAHRRALEWLVSASGEESAGIHRLREWLLGHESNPDQKYPGWPWVRGTAAWVAPTAVGILALDKACRLTPNERARQRVMSGRDFLLHRVCQGGGWNHGSQHALGYQSKAYPETTGLALVALRGTPAAALEPSIQLAQQFLPACRSIDATNWLRLGLAAQRRPPRDYAPPENPTFRTVPEAALSRLAAAAEAGRDWYLV